MSEREREREKSGGQGKTKTNLRENENKPRKCEQATERYRESRESRERKLKYKKWTVEEGRKEKHNQTMIRRQRDRKRTCPTSQRCVRTVSLPSGCIEFDA